MRYQTITDRETWDTALTKLPNSQTLQSWDWGEFKGRWGWQPTRLLWLNDEGQPAGAAQIGRRAIPKTPWSMLYVSRGPVLDYADLSLGRQILSDLEEFARQQNALFVKIDPDVALAFGDVEAVNDPVGEAFQKVLVDRGWCYSPQQIQFKNTVVLDLSPSEADLLAAMKSKWRYNIRLADRKGVVIEPGTVAELETFFDLYAATAQRDNFLIRPKSYYLDVWPQYLQAQPERAAFLLAKVKGEAIAGLILFTYGKTAWYMYGASANKYRNWMPNHLLQWQAIKTAQAMGCLRYDMWGAPDQFDEEDDMWGVYRFKVGFAGQTKQGLGAYDFPVRPFQYKLYQWTLPKLLALLRANAS